MYFSRAKTHEKEEEKKKRRAKLHQDLKLSVPIIMTDSALVLL